MRDSAAAAKAWFTLLKILRFFKYRQAVDGNLLTLIHCFFSVCLELSIIWGLSALFCKRICAFCGNKTVLEFFYGFMGQAKEK